MIHNILKDKPTRLFVILSGFLIANAMVAEFMGVKIFSLEETLGFKPVTIQLFGDSYSFNLTCGVLLWPVVFVMTDIINEYYGRKGVRFISWLAVFLIAYGFLMLFAAMNTTPNAWWVTSKQSAGIENMDKAYNGIFGQGLGIIIASMTAFLIGQLIDVFVFRSIKKRTGEKHIWLRATGSTLVSQFIDSFVVLIIAFYFYPKWVPNQGSPWPVNQVIAIGIVNYLYKFTVAILLTPVIYFVHHRIEKYLGHALALQMKKAAMGEEDGLSDIRDRS
ncbi:MAG TPA: queuosine precursor transporter [Chitinophagaceae bacterium]|nr:queuosine precursor transporter [Chitinophagaceae bacterium]